MREDLCIVYGKMVLYSTITLVYIKKSKIIRREEKLRSLGLVLLFSWIFHQQKKKHKAQKKWVVQVNPNTAFCPPPFLLPPLSQLPTLSLPSSIHLAIPLITFFFFFTNEVSVSLSFPLSNLPFSRPISMPIPPSSPQNPHISTIHGGKRPSENYDSPPKFKPWNRATIYGANHMFSSPCLLAEPLPRPLSCDTPQTIHGKTQGPSNRHDRHDRPSHLGSLFSDPNALSFTDVLHDTHGNSTGPFPV
jgi:hypothetical protein